MRPRGGQPPFPDGLIAAIAATRDLVLGSRCIFDFEPFKAFSEGPGTDIHLEKWFEA